jgi:hypothetical protein
LTQQAADATNALLVNVEQQIGIGQALTTSINRSIGAQDAGNTYWETQQTLAAQQYASQLVPLQNAAPALFATLERALVAAGLPDQAVASSDVKAFEDSVASTGLPSWLTQDLTQLGADSATQQHIQQLAIVQDITATAALGGGQALEALTDPTVSSVNQGLAQTFSQSLVSPTVPLPFNNVGITNDGTPPSSPNFDALGNDYSAQALAAQGITPGASITAGGLAFTWPSAAPGQLDNVQAAGQTIALPATPGATTLGFLGAANDRPLSGTATIAYTDGTTTTATLGFDDWAHLGSPPSAGAFPANSIVATMPYRDTSTGASQQVPVYVFFTSLTLNPSKTATSVTLPAATGDIAGIHIFAMAIGIPTAATGSPTGTALATGTSTAVAAATSTSTATLATSTSTTVPAASPTTTPTSVIG